MTMTMAVNKIQFPLETCHCMHFCVNMASKHTL